MRYTTYPMQSLTGIWVNWKITFQDQLLNDKRHVLRIFRTHAQGEDLKRLELNTTYILNILALWLFEK